MTTVALIRQNHLDRLLGFTAAVPSAANTRPWSSTQLDAFITDVLNESWPDLGKRAQGTVATSQASDVYTIPAALQTGRISRIELEQSSGGVSGRIGKVTSWSYYSDTQVRISPSIGTNAALLLRFFGWIPFLTDATDLPVRLERAIAYRAASLAYGELSGILSNSELQQGLDSGQVVDYPTAVGLSAYWERRYFEIITKDPASPSYAPRRARR